jgi:hypothetical protein
MTEESFLCSACKKGLSKTYSEIMEEKRKIYIHTFCIIKIFKAFSKRLVIEKKCFFFCTATWGNLNAQSEAYLKEFKRDEPHWRQQRRSNHERHWDGLGLLLSLHENQRAGHFAQVEIEPFNRSSTRSERTFRKNRSNYR